MIKLILFLLLCGWLVDIGNCQRSCTQPPPIRDVSLANRGNTLFSGLSAQETQQVIDFLLADKSLGLVKVANSNITSNIIYSIDNYIPRKKKVTEWLDGENKKGPLRMAKATLFLGKTRTVMELLVFPIPNPQYKSELFLNSASRRVQWESRPSTFMELGVIFETLVDEFRPINNVSILRDSFAPNCRLGSVYQCISYNCIPRTVLNSVDRHFYLFFNVDVSQAEANDLYSLPFNVIVKESNFKYQVVKVYYNGREFDSYKSLHNAYVSTPSIRYVLPDLTGSRNTYGSPKFEYAGDRADQSKRPPTQFYPDGQRFNVLGRYVEWLGWSFNLHTRTVGGLQVYDLRYKNQRIAYELSLQDIVVLYTGDTPDDFFKSYFDNGFALGTLASPLIRDYDCPRGAVYLDGTAYEVGTDSPTTIKDSICVFEHRNPVPVRRHYSYGAGARPRFVFSMPDSVLVVRQILSVSNYDYVLDYEIHQTGLIEVKISSTGYIQVHNHPTSGSTKHGYIVNSNLKTIGIFHQHLFNFKMDIDIYGPINNLKMISFKSQRVQSEYAGSHPWYNMIQEETEILREKDAKVTIDFEKPAQHIIYNRKLSSASDPNPRGYRIHVQGMNKVVLPDDMPLIKGGLSWAKYPLSFTRQSDIELGTTSFFIQGNPFTPAINFEDYFLDNNSLYDQDIVAWATVGMHHAPTYEDLPVTTTPGKTLGVMIVPFNYFEIDPSMSSRDAALFWDKQEFNFTNEYLYYSEQCPIKIEKPSFIY